MPRRSLKTKLPDGPKLMIMITIILSLLIGSNICNCFSVQFHDTFTCGTYISIKDNRKYPTTKLSSTKQRNDVNIRTSSAIQNKKLEKELKSLLESKLNKFTNKEPLATILVNHPSICDTICECPHDRYDNVIDLVGKDRFKYMLIKHPTLTVNVLKAKYLKVREI